MMSHQLNTSLMAIIIIAALGLLLQPSPTHSFQQPSPLFITSKSLIKSHPYNNDASSRLISPSPTSTTSLFSSSSPSSSSISQLNTLLTTTKLFSDISIQISPSSKHRYGLFATRDLKPDQVALSIPYDDADPYGMMITFQRARRVFRDSLPESYEGWTGDAGWMALLLLLELAGSNSDLHSSVIRSRRSEDMSRLMSLWIASLPSPDDMSYHPLFWSEDGQERLQTSSTKKIYQLLDDIDDDAAWLEERLWSKNRSSFPSTITLADGTERECFTPMGLTWALSQIFSRSVFVDGALRLIPVLDYVNHDDEWEELRGGGTLGPFGTTRGVQLRNNAKARLNKGEEVCLSYGPKNAIEYLLEYGFLPEAVRESQTSFSELTFELDEKDRFYDDKLDILEFETGAPPPPPGAAAAAAAPASIVQTFDVGGKDGEPDPQMVQFLRLVKLGGTDAFLLESIFRKEVWGFMADPVSEVNEEFVVNGIIEACQKALQEMEDDDNDEDEEADNGAADKESDDDTLDNQQKQTSDETTLSNNNDYEIDCSNVVKNLEQRALSKTLDYMQREKEALDLKEYYQERRLKDLGLDSEWSEDEMNPDVGWGQSRAPGGGDLDW